MAKYGKCAVDAVNLITSHSLSPENAWETAASTIFGEGTSSQRKSCPRAAFLGLCGTGHVKNVTACIYTKSKKNKDYAIKAVRLLQADSSLASSPFDLWAKVIGTKTIRHNNQIDIVIALWNRGLIVDDH